MKKFFSILVLASFMFIGVAYAANEVAPIGVASLNQGSQLRAVTPSDSTVLIQTRAIFNGGAAACTIALILASDTSAVTLSNVQSGAILPLSAVKVMSTNTTCTNIVAIY